MKTIVSVTTAAAILAGALAGLEAQTKSHVISAVKDAQWGPAPPMLPPGAEIAVLAGNPMGTSAYTVRLKFPANYAIPAHSHPTDENVTVISGTFSMGMGDKLDPAKSKAFPAGSFAVAPAKVNHFAFAKGAAIVEVSAIGPFAMTYVNPADDPTKTATK